MMTQNEIQRLHDLSSLQTWDLNDRMRLELSELARRAVQLLIAQSQRIRDLKAVNEAARRSDEAMDYYSRKASKSKPESNYNSALAALYGIFGIKL